MTEFEFKKRTVFLKENYFNYMLNFFENEKKENIFSYTLPQYIQDRGMSEVKAYYKGLSWFQCSSQQECVQLKYSAGAEIQEVVNETQLMLSRFHKDFSIDFPCRKLYLWEEDSYIYILWLLSLAVLSDSKDYLFL